jgi:hypothetical protein
MELNYIHRDMHKMITVQESHGQAKHGYTVHPPPLWLLKYSPIPPLHLVGGIYPHQEVSHAIYSLETSCSSLPFNTIRLTSVILGFWSVSHLCSNWLTRIPIILRAPPISDKSRSPLWLKSAASKTSRTFRGVLSPRQNVD